MKNVICSQKNRVIRIKWKERKENIGVTEWETALFTSFYYVETLSVLQSSRCYTVSFMVSLTYWWWCRWCFDGLVLLHLYNHTSPDYSNGAPNSTDVHTYVTRNKHWGELYWRGKLLSKGDDVEDGKMKQREKLFPIEKVEPVSRFWVSLKSQNGTWVLSLQNFLRGFFLSCNPITHALFREIK